MSQPYTMTLANDDVNTQSYLFEYIIIKLPINKSRKVIVFF